MVIIMMSMMMMMMMMMMILIRLNDSKKTVRVPNGGGIPRLLHSLGLPLVCHGVLGWPDEPAAVQTDWPKQ